MILAVRVIFITALLLKFNLFSLALQQELPSANTNEAHGENAITMLYPENSGSQNSINIADLKKAETNFKSNKNNTVGIETYLKFGNYYLSENKPDSALLYLNKALYFSNILNDSFFVARSNQEIGNYHYSQGNLIKAKENFENARDIFTSLKDTFWLLPQLNHLANIEWIQGNKQHSKKLFHAIINLATSQKHNKIVALANYGLGEILYTESNLYEAFYCFKTSKEIWVKSKNSKNLAKTLNKLGLIYLQAGMDSLAFSTLNESLSLTTDKDFLAIAEINASLSTIYLNNIEFDKALAAINTAIQKSNASGNTFYYVSHIIKKANILCQNKNYFESRSLIEGALNIIKEHNLPHLKVEGLEVYSRILYKLGLNEEASRATITAFEEAKKNNNLKQIQKNAFMLGQLMNEKGQYISASRFLLMSNQYKDSLRLKREDSKLKNAIFQFEMPSNDKITETNRTNKKWRNSINNKESANGRIQNLLLISIILLVVLITFFSILVFKGYRSKKNATYDFTGADKDKSKETNELEKLAVLNNKIFSIISHDLRSPIISIKDSIEFLQQEDLDEETKQEALVMSEELTEATLNLLDNLLGWAKNQKKRVEPKKVHVNILTEIKQIEYLYKAAMNKKEINLTIDCDEQLAALADNELINLALRNLVSNAVKFTPRGGNIYISGEVFKNKILVSVKDTGLGISREDQLKILNPETFFTKNGTENESGSGIGLKLVNEFIKLMGGELKIESSMGQGSKFLFTLPRFITKKKSESHEKIFQHKIN